MRPLSLRSRLLCLIIGVLAAVLLPLGILSAQRTLEEVDELSDGRLAQAARTLEVLVNRIGVEQLRQQRTARLLVPSRLSLIHISEPTRPSHISRMPSSA